MLYKAKALNFNHIRPLNFKSEPHQVLEETNKAGLSALLLAIQTDQPEVGNTF